MRHLRRDSADDGPECGLIRDYNIRKQDRLRQTLHKAIGDCCAQGTISSWVCSPSEAEVRIFDALVDLNFN
jgi:hypothetical protein